MTDRADVIHPVILSGGAGTRLWPLSRALYPKQLLPLVSERTMLQETAGRVQNDKRFATPLVVCNDEHRFIVAEQVREIGADVRAIVVEPVGRNTAPATAVAALLLSGEDEHALLLILPSDHTIGDTAGFRAAAERAVPAARAGALVTFGMKPLKPEVGYGYIRQGAPFPNAPGCYSVERFVEKPNSHTARSMLGEGRWLWNSGMFLFSAKSYLKELDRFHAGMTQMCRNAIERGREDLDFFRLDAEAFEAVASESIDYAVMEHTEAAAVVPANIGWNDIGSWSALWESGKKDVEGNITIGDVIAEGVRDSYVRTDGPLVAVVGVRDILVVATEDALLVTTNDTAQDVKKVVETLKASGSRQHISHVRVYRPWGSYQTTDAGDRFQVKQLVVKPGAKLSLQSHNHRAEHWVVVSGTARVTRGDETFDLQVNESTYIPIGTRHRLENPGTGPLRVIEVQSGGYLGEDDIVRYDDVYGRSKT